MHRLSTLLILIALFAGLTGCAGRVEVFPNDDTRLRKMPAEFAADAARRFPYKGNAARGGQALASAEAGYFLDRLDIINLSETSWTDVEVWINGEYVIYLPEMEPRAIKKLQFQAFFNETGQSFPTHTGSWYNPKPVMITRVELYRDGKLYNVPVRAGE